VLGQTHLDLTSSLCIGGFLFAFCCYTIAFLFTIKYYFFLEIAFSLGMRSFLFTLARPCLILHTYILALFLRSVVYSHVLTLMFCFLWFVVCSHVLGSSLGIGGFLIWLLLICFGCLLVMQHVCIFGLLLRFISNRFATSLCIRSLSFISMHLDLYFTSKVKLANFVITNA
jgi:hypothetical protein